MTRRDWQTPLSLSTAGRWLSEQNHAAVCMPKAQLGDPEPHGNPSAIHSAHNALLISKENTITLHSAFGPVAITA